MANTILSCAVWCEVHGPVNIFCTQTGDASSPPATATSTASVDTPLHPPTIAPSPPSKASCASCSLYLPPALATPGVAPVLKTRDGDVTYVSMRNPPSQVRYKAVRSACIRALSCELLPGRTGPVFFGDPSIGYTIAYIFRLADTSSTTTTTAANTHDGRRQYALMCTATQEQELLQSWTFITERFRVLASKIIEGSQAVVRQQTEAKHRGLKDTTVSMDRDRSFLRPKGRVLEKNLAEVIGMEDIFVQLHAAFAWMLGIWRVHFEGSASAGGERRQRGESPIVTAPSAADYEDLRKTVEEHTI